MEKNGDHVTSFTIQLLSVVIKFQCHENGFIVLLETYSEQYLNGPKLYLDHLV